MQRKTVMTMATVVMVAGVGTGVAFVPDVFAAIETMFMVEEIVADREEHALALRYQACRNILKACGVHLVEEIIENMEEQL